MANFVDKFNVVTAMTDNTKLDLGHSHITTANFMQINPVLCKEMVPGEKVDVDLMTFTRLQPLAVPTFGRASVKERAYFVPFRTVFRGWNDFITDTPHVFSGASSKTVSIIPEVPTVTNAALIYTIIQGYFDNANQVPVFVDLNSYISVPDLVIIDLDGNPQNIKLTAAGRQAVKIFESLGYKIVWDLRNKDTYSALPLMAFAKVIMDWYFPSQYVNTGLYADVMGVLNYDGPFHLSLDWRIVAQFLEAGLYANYDSDYFVSAWDNPAAPTNGVYSSFSIMDVTLEDRPYQYGTQVVGGFGVNAGVSTNGTPHTVQKIAGSESGYNNLTGPNSIGMSVSDYQHKALSLLTDYMKRHQLVGARAMDRYLARFGKTLSAEKLNRSNYISSKAIPVQIGDVMSNSSYDIENPGSGLGSFAGRGFAYEEGFKFDWATNEYGMLLVLSTIIPASGMWQGLNRHVMHKTKLDFWTPEFDNLGVQAISTRELYNTHISNIDMSNENSEFMGFNKSVFGFAPRYGEYKYMNDNLTGDFTYSSLNNGTSANKSAWHLFRTLGDHDFYDAANNNYNYGNLVHSMKFVTGLNDHEQYNRIFQYVAENPNEQPDPFTLIYNFNMVSYAPMKPLYETYQFDDMDSGKTVSTQVNGVKAN